MRPPSAAIVKLYGVRFDAYIQNLWVILKNRPKIFAPEFKTEMGDLTEKTDVEFETNVVDYTELLSSYNKDWKGGGEYECSSLQIQRLHRD